MTHTDPSEKPSAIAIPDIPLMAALIDWADTPLLTEEDSADPDPKLIARKLGRDRPDAVKRSIARMADAGLLTLAPLAIPPRTRAMMRAYTDPDAVLAGADADAATGLKAVYLRQLTPNPDNPRRAEDIDDSEIEALADNIKARGVLQNLTVRATGDVTDDDLPVYMLDAGERRFHALSLLAAAYDPQDDLILGTWPAADYPIPVRILPAMDRRDALLLALSENMQREDLHDLEEGDAFIRLADEHGMSAPQIAAHFSGKRTARYVQQRIQIARGLTQDQREAFRDGDLTFTAARELVQQHAEKPAEAAAPAHHPEEPRSGVTKGAPDDEPYLTEADKRWRDASPEQRNQIRQELAAELDEWNKQPFPGEAPDDDAGDPLSDPDLDEDSDEAQAAALMADVKAGNAISLYRGAIQLYHDAICAGDEDAAVAAAQRMRAILIAVNDGTNFGVAVNDAPQAVKAACAADPGAIPLWGQDGYFEAEANGVRALVSLTQGTIHAVDFHAPFPSHSGYQGVAPGLNGFVALGKTPQQGGADMILASIAYGERKDNPAWNRGLTLPATIYALDDNGEPAPVSRGVYIDPAAPPAGIDVAALAELTRQYDEQRFASRPNVTWPFNRHGNNFYIFAVNGPRAKRPYEPVRDFPADRPYVIADRTRTDRVCFRFVADPADPAADFQGYGREGLDDDRHHVALPRRPLTLSGDAPPAAAAEDDTPDLPMPARDPLAGSPGTLIDRLFAKINAGQATLLVQGDDEARAIAMKLHERGAAGLAHVQARETGQSLRFTRQDAAADTGEAA